MYIPKPFAESDTDVLYDFIRHNPFATVVSHVDGGLNADHLPIYLNMEDPRNSVLQGHIASSNPLWKAVSDTREVLVIFQGSNAYISPNWLPSKEKDGRVVPTWNYSAVHIKGTITFIHEDSWKLELLNRQTLFHEKDFENPWRVSDAPPGFVAKLLPNIVGFEIAVKDIFGKFKLSQNQSQENRKGIMDALDQRGHEMAKSISQG